VPKVHNKPIKRPRKGSNKQSKRQPKYALVCRTGLSGVPPDSVRCTRELEAELATFGKMGGRSAIIHRTVRWSTGQCPVPHRTVRCARGATAISRQRSTANAFNALQCTTESEQRQKAHQTVYRTCLVHHWTAQRPHQSELQRSEPNDRVTWLAHRTVSGGAPDCSVRHTTAAFTKRLVWWLGL
jgi:hypothetical protein